FELFLRQRRQTRRFHSRVSGPEYRAASRPRAISLCGTERGREVSSYLIGFFVWNSLCGKQSFSPAWETAHGFRSIPKNIASVFRKGLDVTRSSSCSVWRWLRPLPFGPRPSTVPDPA